MCARSRHRGMSMARRAGGMAPMVLWLAHTAWLGLGLGLGIGLGIGLGLALGLAFGFGLALRKG
jgi:hypothetical protein